jgi:NAD-reducing hydrogenase large subunit
MIKSSVSEKTGLVQAPTAKRIVIDPVSRVEGHGRVTIVLDERGKVRRCRLHITEFRGFERFIQGRLLWEVPVIVQRLCGICPVSHHLTAAKAMDFIVGIDAIPPAAEKLRRLMHYGQMLQSHATHFYHLASPDFLFGPEAGPLERSIAGVIKRYPEFAHRGIMLRKFGQEIIEATAGKKVHGTGAVPGGVNKNLSISERDGFLAGMRDIIDWSAQAVSFIKDLLIDRKEGPSLLGDFESNHLCTVAPGGGMDLYGGRLKAITATGKPIFDQVPCGDYLSYIREEVQPWSYAKFPFIVPLGPRRGWFRVGPLARLNVCASIDTPKAEAARREFSAQTSGKPNNFTMWYHWARMIEGLHAAEKINDLLHDNELQSSDLIAARGERREEAVAVLEAPRGTLLHHYRVDGNDQITMANLIVPTTENNEPMNQAVTQVVEYFINEKPWVTDVMLDHVEVAVRAYDPCLSCSTHAIGSMPLVVELYDAKGCLIQTVSRPS